MQVLCGTCRQPIPVEHVDLGRGLAKCAACGVLFDCSAQLDGIAGHMPSPAPEREPITAPAGFRVFRGKTALRIEYHAAPSRFVLLPFVVLAVAIVCVVTNYLMGGAPRRPESGIDALKAIGVGVFGLALAYGSLAGLLNRRTITVAEGWLRTKEEPTPMPGGRALCLASLRQIHVKAVGDRSRIRNNGVSYVLYATVERRGDVALTRCLRTEEEALFLEQEIESFLDIAGQPVAGEVER